MLTSDFDYNLPPECIAQTPLEPRDSSRLLVLERADGSIAHGRFHEIGEYLRPGDLLVFNDTRVIPARLFGRKAVTGGKVELLLLSRKAPQTWEALAGGAGLRPGATVEIENGEGLEAEVLEDLGGARRLVQFSRPLAPLLPAVGHTPLPPYIHAPLADPERYQTVYARVDGSAAAPTAGLHFTPDLLLRLRGQGIEFAYVTLHVGLDTFAPVNEELAEAHAIHSEWCELSSQTARQINQARLAGRRVVAVGTTAVRVLESAALASLRLAGMELGAEVEEAACPPMALRWRAAPGQVWRPVVALNGPTNLFILPGHRFRAVDALITNFHLPRSSLLMLVSAFAGRESVLSAYAEAMKAGYRFYSFGDAMLIL